MHDDDDISNLRDKAQAGEPLTDDEIRRAARNVRQSLPFPPPLSLADFIRTMPSDVVRNNLPAIAIVASAFGFTWTVAALCQKLSVDERELARMSVLFRGADDHEHKPSQV